MNREKLAAGLVLAVLVGGALLSPRLVPFDMDEFAHYQPLGCLAHPLNREHNLRRESCGAYDLRLPFTTTFLPLRSYLYIGSLPVVPFYPFWRILADPVAARVQGVFFFWLSGLLVARLTGAPALVGILASLVLPAYFFSYLVDTGPVGLSMVLLLLALLCLQRLSDHPGILGAVGAGFLLFLGVFTKPVFAWALPAVGVYALVQSWNRRRLIVPVAVGLLLPLCALALAEDRDGDAYLHVLRVGGVSPLGVGGVLGHFLHYASHGADILPRSLTITSSWLDVFPLLVVLSLLPFALRGAEGRLLLGLAALTLLATVFTGSAFWPHHFAYTWVFVVLALARGLRERPAATPLASAAILAFLVSVVIRLPAARQSPEANAAKDHLLAYLATLGSRFVEVHTSWGTFYIRHLFGAPEEEVVYLRFREWTESKEEVASVKTLAEAQGRGILVLTSRPEGMTNTTLVAQALGPPLSRHVFENWEVLEYVR